MMVALILEERLMSGKKQRRSWTPDEKAEIVLAGLRGDRSPSGSDAPTRSATPANTSTSSASP
jgi:transposase-like protein